MLGAAASSQSDPYGSPLQPGGRQFGYPEPQQRDFPPAYDPAIYGTRQQEQAPAYPSETSFDDPARAPHGEEAFEEDYGEERARRGLKIALVLAGLAIIGTSGVLGYRVVFGGAPSGPPPVIKANTTPSKIVPEAAAEASNKQIYDRVGDTSEGERVVPREEKPVEVKDSSRVAGAHNFPQLAGLLRHAGNGDEGQFPPAGARDFLQLSGFLRGAGYGDGGFAALEHRSGWASVRRTEEDPYRYHPSRSGRQQQRHRQHSRAAAE